MMACFESCCDRGKRCPVSTERFTCFDCGKIKPHYNFESKPCGTCPPTEPCNHPVTDKKGKEKEKEKDRWRPDVCRCKQSCWEWILSFLGIGGKLPDCCRNVRLSAWQSGEVAREALVSKVQDVVNRVSGRDQSPVVARSSKTAFWQDNKDAEKKTVGPAPDKDVKPLDSKEELSDQQTGKDQPTQTGGEKKGKTSGKSRSSSSQRGRSRRKKGQSKSRSTSRSDKQRTKKSSNKARSTSSSSTSLSIADTKRSGRPKSRSRSGSSTKIFNPFKGRQPHSRCSSAGNIKSPICPPLPSPTCPPARSFLSRLNEEQVAVFPEKHTSPICKDLQPCSTTQPTHIRRSNSMSYRPYPPCPNPAPGSCRCASLGPLEGPRLPCRSQSFDATPMKFASTHTCCLSTPCPPTCLASSVGQVKPCGCSMRSNSTLTPYTRVSCIVNKPHCCCNLISKPPSSVCPPCCTKPCCIPHSAAFSCPSRQYATQSTPMSRMTCSTVTALSYLKAKQNEAICQQLLAKYGYSPPLPRPCPVACYGCSSEGPCPAMTCVPNYSRVPGVGGCRACRPDQHDAPGSCEQVENFTNSRKTRSPECCALNKQCIEFNASPCDRSSLCEFQLPPHCIRKTGPRSPVGEFMAIMRVPKPVKRQDSELPAPPEGTQDATKTKTETAGAAKSGKKKSRKQMRKKTAKDETENNANANAKMDSPGNNSGKCQLYIATRSLSLCNTDDLASAGDSGSLGRDEWCDEHEPVTAAGDCCPVNGEESCNNNYGGESYRLSRYSSSGPVQVDFTELNPHSIRFSHLAARSSASSAFIARYSRPSYHATSRNFDVRPLTSLTSHNRDTRDLFEPLGVSQGWYTPRNISNLSTPNPRSDGRALPYNISTNSVGLEASEGLKSSRYYIHLENAIENKIRELRESRTFDSPPVRKRLIRDSLFLNNQHENSKPSASDKNDLLQQNFIRESWEQLNRRAERRRKESMFSNQYLNTSQVPGTYVSDEAAADSTITNHLQNPEVFDSSYNRSNAVLNPSGQKVNKQSSDNQFGDTKLHEAANVQKETVSHMHQSPRLRSEYVSDRVETKLQDEYPLRFEQPKAKLGTPVGKTEYVPDFEYLLNRLEQNAQTYNSPVQQGGSEPGDFLKQPRLQEKLKIQEGEKQEGIQKELERWREDKQPGNKLEKTLPNTRALVAESSPPQKPVLLESPEGSESLSGSSYRTNSRGTSSVGLRVCRSGPSDPSSRSISESASCGEMSLTYTKLSDAPRPEQDSSREDLNHFADQRSVSTVMSNYTECAQDMEEIRELCDTMTPCLQMKVRNENNKLPSVRNQPCTGSDDNGSSVDPDNVSSYAETGDGIRHVPSSCNIACHKVTYDYTFEDIQSAKVNLVNKLSVTLVAETAATVSNNNDSAVDMIPAQQSPIYNKSLSEMMREFIRRNGTPV